MNQSWLLETRHRRGFRATGPSHASGPSLMGGSLCHLFPVMIAGCLLACELIAWGSGTQTCVAQEQRARPPEFARPNGSTGNNVSRVFFTNVKDAFRGSRPTLADLRGSSEAVALKSNAAAETAASIKAWSKYVSPISLENEIKRIRLRYDASLTTPGAFKGGGFQSARLDLSVLATLFAVVAKYDGDVRWQSEAAKARDLLSRTARNCATGSTQTFNEARLRKADLQDLVSGAALTVNQEPESDNDWSMITERSPMMEYVEQVLDDLSDHSRDLATTKSNVDAIRQGSEIIALMGEVLAQDGMDDSDDEDYVSLSRAMTKAASRVVAAIQRDDFESVRAAVGGISQTCADCHEQYR